ncbi:MAG: hypothetical protein AAB681_00600 [Patescibacteria group bacterium]
MDTVMKPEEVKALAEKVKNSTATVQEELALLQFLNKGVEEMRAFIKDITTELKS